jgi:hypothetical protein
MGGGKKQPLIVCPRGKECGYSRRVDDAAVQAAGDRRRGSEPAGPEANVVV